MSPATTPSSRGVRYDRQMPAKIDAMPTGLRPLHGSLRKPLLSLLQAQINGVENVPTSGGFLLAANHRAFLDHFLLAAATPRPIRFIGKESLAEGLGGRFNTAMGMIPVRRGTADAEMMETASAVLRAGVPIAIFPEGTRSRTGELYRFRSGMARLAVETGVPIVPTGIRGSWRVWPPENDLPYFRIPPHGLVEVTFCKPVVVASDTPRARRDATNLVYDRIAHACGQPRNNGYAPIGG